MPAQRKAQWLAQAPAAQRRRAERALDRPADGLAALRPRLDDFMAAVASPGSDERLQIARRVIANAGIDPVTPQGRDRLRRHLEERMLAVAAESASITTAVDTGNALTASTLFRDRGLSSDTSLGRGLRR